MLRPQQDGEGNAQCGLLAWRRATYDVAAGGRGGVWGIVVTTGTLRFGIANATLTAGDVRGMADVNVTKGGAKIV